VAQQCIVFCKITAVARTSLVTKDLAYEAKVKAKTLSSLAKAKTFTRCPRGSSRPRPGLEDKKTGKNVLW